MVPNPVPENLENYADLKVIYMKAESDRLYPVRGRAAGRLVRGDHAREAGQAVVVLQIDREVVGEHRGSRHPRNLLADQNRLSK
mgnify:CR=1 FL=1